MKNLLLDTNMYVAFKRGDGFSEGLQRGSLRRRQEPGYAARLAGLDIRLAADLDHASA